MSSSREESPDWLRSFQAPTKSVITLSFSSDSSPNNSLGREVEAHHEEPAVVSKYKNQVQDQNQELVLIESGEESPLKRSPKSKSLKKKKQNTHILKEGDGSECEVAEDEILEKTAEPRVSSRMPLVFSEKVIRSKALVECEGDSIDMSGDVGAVGRVIISNTPAENPELLLDLKGTIYRTTIVPSRTFCVVSFGQSEAKIEAVMNDFIQLKSLSNVYDCETMIEGTLEGFSFGSDDEGEKMLKASAPQIHQDNQNEGPSGSKSKRKAEKSLGVARKRAKTVAKPTTKAGKKSQAPKKANKSKNFGHTTGKILGLAFIYSFEEPDTKESRKIQYWVVFALPTGDEYFWGSL